MNYYVKVEDLTTMRQAAAKCLDGIERGDYDLAHGAEVTYRVMAGRQPGYGQPWFPSLIEMGNQ